MKTTIALTNSHSPATPIRFSLRAATPDEDGARAGAEVELGVEDAKKARDMLDSAILLVKTGVWP